MKISVALAAYKGEKYLGEQIESILPQLGQMDEIVVSDDLPGGETQKIVEFYHEYDSRVRYIIGPGRGVCRNFEYAISNCGGDVIFLCDQDDVWLPNKVGRVMKVIENGADLVMHDARVTDAYLNTKHDSFFTVHNTRPGFAANFIRNSFVGCCIAFRAEIKRIVLPFPQNLPMHDQWIGLLTELYGRVELINEPLILYRRHGDNVTGGRASLARKLKWRYDLAREIARRTSKLNKSRGVK
ncbi:MAG: glycosyltransferase family 2 protein, partial [Clostridiales bacterium]|nr:glycosyltransferase family 2 protein [Clostridiales bacterium]